MFVCYKLNYSSYTTWNYPRSIGFTHQIQAVGDENSIELSSVIDEILHQVNAQQSDQEDEQQEMI